MFLTLNQSLHSIYFDGVCKAATTKLKQHYTTVTQGLLYYISLKYTHTGAK